MVSRANSESYTFIISSDDVGYLRHKEMYFLTIFKSSFPN